MSRENINRNKGIPIPCNKKSFYIAWLSFLTPIHKMTPQVIGIAAEFLRHRDILKSKILDEVVLVKEIQAKEIREQIMKDCGVTLSTFRVAVNKLKKAQFLKDGRINQRLIPNLADGETKFNLLLMFDINDG